MGPHPGAAGLSLSPEGWSAEGAWAPEALSPLEGKEARKWLENISRRLDLGLPVCGGGGGGAWRYNAVRRFPGSGSSLSSAPYLR